MKTYTIDDLKFRTRPDTVYGCWIWTGGKDKDGYARWDAAQRLIGTRAAHRISFFLSNGFMPEWPMVIDHICNRRDCVNPDHLQVLHHIDNAFKDYPYSGSKSACPRGHNRWRYRKGGRECLDCRNIFKRRYRARKAAGLVDYSEPLYKAIAATVTLRVLDAVAKASGRTT